MLNFGDELRTLEQIGKATYSPSETFKDSVRQSMQIQCNSLGEQDKHQFRVKINARKLAQLLANYLDGNIVAESRRRTPTHAPTLWFVGELLNLGHDIEISFHFDRAENKVGFLKSHSPQQTKETWLETVLIRAINAMNGSIVFQDLEGSDDR